MRAITQYSFGLYKRRDSAPRPEHLVAIEQQWRSISAAGRLRLSVRRDRRSISIGDTPSVPMMMRHLPPGSLDPKARKDSLIHAHAVPRE